MKTKLTTIVNAPSIMRIKLHISHFCETIMRIKLDIPHFFEGRGKELESASSSQTIRFPKKIIPSTKSVAVNTATKQARYCAIVTEIVTSTGMFMYKSRGLSFGCFKL
mmetsp:Transcript_38006/g.66655  ORF Transcript_38006/g.66655 Transcript_38006/m.66655 type:complete len:108 (-) Transcript_38006:15-338(-)